MISMMKFTNRGVRLAGLVAVFGTACRAAIAPFPAPATLPPCIIEYSSDGSIGSSRRDVLYRSDHTYEELFDGWDGITTTSGTGSGTSPLHSGLYSYVLDPADPYHASILYSGGGSDQLYFDSPTSGNQSFAGSGATFPGSFFELFPKRAESGAIAFSTRCELSANGSVTVGLVVAPGGPRWVLIRAVSSSLADYGVVSSLAKPSFKLYNSSGGVIGTSSVWSADPNLVPSYNTVFSMVGEFPLKAGSDEGVMLVALPPGVYTAVFTGTGSGQILCEAYLLPY